MVCSSSCRRCRLVGHRTRLQRADPCPRYPAGLVAQVQYQRPAAERGCQWRHATLPARLTVGMGRGVGFLHRPPRWDRLRMTRRWGTADCYPRVVAPVLSSAPFLLFVSIPSHAVTPYGVCIYGKPLPIPRHGLVAYKRIGATEAMLLSPLVFTHQPARRSFAAVTAGAMLTL